MDFTSTQVAPFIAFDSSRTAFRVSGLVHRIICNIFLHLSDTYYERYAGPSFREIQAPEFVQAQLESLEHALQVNQNNPWISNSIKVEWTSATWTQLHHSCVQSRIPHTLSRFPHHHTQSETSYVPLLLSWPHQTQCWSRYQPMIARSQVQILYTWSADMGRLNFSFTSSHESPA